MAAKSSYSCSVIQKDSACWCSAAADCCYYQKASSSVGRIMKTSVTVSSRYRASYRKDRTEDGDRRLDDEGRAQPTERLKDNSNHHARALITIV